MSSEMKTYVYSSQGEDTIRERMSSLNNVRLQTVHVTALIMAVNDAVAADMERTGGERYDDARILNSAVSALLAGSGMLARLADIGVMLYWNDDIPPEGEGDHDE